MTAARLAALSAGARRRKPGVVPPPPPPPPPPVSGRLPAFSVHPQRHQLTDYSATVNWLGYPDLSFGDNGNDYGSNLAPATTTIRFAGQQQQANRKRRVHFRYAVCRGPNQSPAESLARANRGEHDAAYRAFVAECANAGIEQMSIALSWEENGNWGGGFAGWSINGYDPNVWRNLVGVFKQANSRCASILREECARRGIKVEIWRNPTVDAFNPSRRAFLEASWFDCDVLASDHYDDDWSRPPNLAVRNVRHVEQMRWVEATGRHFGVPVALGEWGMSANNPARPGGGDNPGYVDAICLTALRNGGNGPGQWVELSLFNWPFAGGAAANHRLMSDSSNVQSSARWRAIVRGEVPLLAPAAALSERARSTVDAMAFPLPDLELEKQRTEDLAAALQTSLGVRLARP